MYIKYTLSFVVFKFCFCKESLHSGDGNTVNPLSSNMQCALTIVRYPRWFGWAGLLSMALFRIPLSIQSGNRFWKLMGCGKNGTFDIQPDLYQWALMQYPFQASIGEGKGEDSTPVFIKRWWKIFRCEIWQILLEPIEGHGTWDGKPVFGDMPKQTDSEGEIAVLTRATIRLRKFAQFWKHVGAVANQMNDAPGFITSLGIGEIPWIKQATFSVWASKEHMKQFAYQLKEHADVVRKTRKERWYSEDMFVRFKILSSSGTIKGINPLSGKS
jgi:hypothetical protein